MIVIADSSPLIALAVIGKLDMLEKLYQEFYVPAAVFEEVTVKNRLVQLAEAYRAILKLYQRVQAAAEFDPQVGYAFAFLGDHFGAGKKKGKKKSDASS